MGLEWIEWDLKGVVILGVDHVGMDLLGLFKAGSETRSGSWLLFRLVGLWFLCLVEFEFGGKIWLLEFLNCERKEGGR